MSEILKKTSSQYKILLSKDFIKDVKKILKSGEKQILAEIQKTLDELKRNPHDKRPTVDIKLISSKKESIYRVRLGKYRLIYEINEKTNTIYITMFFIRGKGYK